MLNMYSVYDSAAMIYTTPFYFHLDTEAVRVVESGLTDKNTYLARSPQDFALYKVGKFDEQTGQVISFENPEKIITAVEILKSMIKRDEQQMDIEEQTQIHSDNYTA